MLGSKTKKCPFCGSANPKEAVVCELCGRGLVARRYTLVKFTIGAALIITLVSVIYVMQKVPLSVTGSLHAPRLELVSSAGYHSMSGEMVVEGKVRNISGDMLENIQVVVSWYDKQGNQLSQTKSAIYLNPVLSFQASPFRVSLPYDPQMERYDLSFTTPQGEAIYTRDRREKTKS